MARTERSGHTTTDHDFIRQWVEERGGWPARVAGTGTGDDPGLIRIDFPGFSGEGSLERIEWDQWFEGFESSELAFLHRDMDHGGGDLDRFNKLISRTGEEDGEGSERGTRGRSSTASSARGGSSSRKSGSARKSGASKTSGSSRGGEETGGTSRRSTRSSSNGEARETASGAARARGGAAAEDGGPAAELRELLLHELGDLLSAEKLFVQGTRALAREAQDPEVKARIEEHVTETERQAERVKEAFAAIGERAKAVKCEAAQGLKEEHDSFKSEEKPSKLVLSAFDLGSGLRVEHYEIAAYRSAIALATALGEAECARILKENLDEELAMASFLEKNSLAVLKRMLTGDGAMADGAAPARKSNGAAASKSGRSSAAKSGGASSSRKSGGASAKKSGGSSSARKSGGSSRKSSRA